MVDKIIKNGKNWTFIFADSKKPLTVNEKRGKLLMRYYERYIKSKR